MKCPECGSPSLNVEVQFAGKVACRFADSDNFEVIDDVELDSNWDDKSLCECLVCRWRGTVYAARLGDSQRPHGEDFSGKPQGHSTPMTEQDLLKLRELLKTQPCPAAWRERIERLISEVDRLNSLLETIGRLSEHDPGSSSGDTVLG